MFAQASGSSDFKITVQFDAEIPVMNVSAYYTRKSGTWFDAIGIERDSSSNQLIISGHNSYITRVTFPPLVFSISERVLDVRTNDSVDVTTQFILLTKEFESFDEKEITLKTIHFSKNKPCVLINGIQRPDKYGIVKAEMSALTSDKRFEYVFVGNESVLIDEL